MDYLKSVVPSQLINERGSNLVVINPGSANVRIGFANQQVPFNMPNCIARHVKESGDGSKGNWQDQNLHSQPTPSQQLERETAYDIIASLLKIPYLDEAANNSFPRKMGTIDGNTSHQSRNETSFSWTNVMERKPKSPVAADTAQAAVSAKPHPIVPNPHPHSQPSFSRLRAKPPSLHSPQARSIPMRRGGDGWGRKGGVHRLPKQGIKGMAVRLAVALIVLFIGTLSLYSTIRVTRPLYRVEIFHVDKLWKAANSSGWRPSSAPRSYWPPLPNQSNGFLRVRCNGGLNQQRTAICNAVLAARIMNATLVLPELDTNSFWHDESGFPGIYDVEHFIHSLRFDIRIVQSLPDVSSNGKTKKMKAFQIRPPRDAPLSWYTSFALQEMKKHGAIYLTPFSHRLAEEIDDPELQRLRCRVNYHALRFKPHIMKLSTDIVEKLRSQGHFMSIHLRFEMDMLAFAGCVDIFTPEEQEILIKYRKENFAEKELVYRERRLIGKCPLTPEEVGIILRSMGFDNTTRIYIAAGELFGGDRFMNPFRKMFPLLENHSTVVPSEKLEENARGLVGSAVDYMVCLMSDIFMPTYDGPSNFANNLMGHRLYYGFRTIIQPDRKALAPIFMDREEGRVSNFGDRIKQVMFNSKFGGPHKRVRPESFYTNSWPECFCQISTENPAHKCPPNNVMEVSDGQLQNEATI